MLIQFKHLFKNYSPLIAVKSSKLEHCVHEARKAMDLK